MLYLFAILTAFIASLEGDAVLFSLRCLALPCLAFVDVGVSRG